jgi:hypothetical protein
VSLNKIFYFGFTKLILNGYTIKDIKHQKKRINDTNVSNVLIEKKMSTTAGVFSALDEASKQKTWC